MSGIDEVFKNAVRAVSKSNKDWTHDVFEVREVNEQDNICKAGPWDKVRLNAIVDNIDSQITVYPKVGSKVIVGKMDQYLFVSKYSEIDKVKIKIGTQIFEMKANEFLINQGNDGGLIKINDLKLQYDSNITAIKSAVSAGFAIIDTALGLTSAAAFNTAANAIQPLNLGTLENTKVKHG
jgi:hypothetical protein